MTIESKKIGGKYGLICSFIGLAVAYFIFSLFIYTTSIKPNLLESIFWISNVNFVVNVLVGSIIMIAVSYLIGRDAGYQVLTKKRNHNIVGFGSGITVLFLSSLFSGVYGLLTEGVVNSDDFLESFIDYIVKPFFWIVLVGFLPSLGVGFWFGEKLYTFR